MGKLPNVGKWWVAQNEYEFYRYINGKWFHSSQTANR